jgi:hypothetical protein
VRRPIYTDSVGLWRHYRSELAELIEILEPVLSQGGDESAVGLSSD